MTADQAAGILRLNAALADLDPSVIASLSADEATAVLKLNAAAYAVLDAATDELPPQRPPTIARRPDGA